MREEIGRPPTSPGTPQRIQPAPGAPPHPKDDRITRVPEPDRKPQQPDPTLPS